MKRPKTILFIFFLAVYLITAGGHLYTRDDYTMYLVTESIVTRASFDIPLGGHSVEGLDGRQYSIFGLGQSFVAIPFYSVGKGLDALLGQNFLKQFLVTAQNSFIMALICVLLFSFCLDLGYSVRTAIFLSWVYGFGTMAWVYSKNFTNEPLAAVALLFSLYALLRYKRQQSNKWLALSGLGLGIGMLTRYEVVITVPLLLLYLLGGKKKRKKETLIQILYWAIPIGAFIGIMMGYNFLRFCSAMETGYHTWPSYESAPFSIPIYVGLYRLLLSPGRSLFLYSPFLILVLLNKYLLKENKKENILFLGIAVELLLFYAIYGLASGWCWGSRRWLVVLPFLVLSMGGFIERISRKKLLMGGLLILNLVPQIIGVSIDPINHFLEIDEKTGGGKRMVDFMPQIDFNPRYSPLFCQAKGFFSYAERTKKSILEKSRPPEVQKNYFVARRYYRDKSFDFWWLYLYYYGVSAKYILLILVILLTVASGSFTVIWRFAFKRSEGIAPAHNKYW